MSSYGNSTKLPKHEASAAATKYNENNKQPKSFTTNSSKKYAKHTPTDIKQTVQPTSFKPQRVKPRENKVSDTNKKPNKNVGSTKKNKQTEFTKKGKKHFKQHANSKIPQIIKLSSRVRRILPMVVKTKIETFLAWSVCVPRLLKLKKFIDYRTIERHNTQEKTISVWKRKYAHNKKNVNNKTKLIFFKKKLISPLSTKGNRVVKNKYKKLNQSRATEWNENNRLMQLKNFRRKNLLKSFLTALKLHAAGVGQKEAHKWEVAQRLHLARWFVANTRRRGVKKTNLLQRVYSRAHWLKKNGSPEKARIFVVMRTAEASLIREQSKNLESRFFLQTLTLLRKQLVKWIKICIPKTKQSTKINEKIFQLRLRKRWQKKINVKL